ncbi:dihydropteroate synthase [uncultured Alistipes sp.]|uniref:dihydropteroate synthase n=1 Tax=uncultured Alistipes sp. TaxID=538949 RepID=UPI00262401A7|nr:dihydropteroate synthase [uncultured Alistipes sp.]
MKLTVGNRVLSLDTPVVMTIVNVTPDSFYAESRTHEADAVARRAERAAEEGAALLDVGGYSSRPGAADVPPDEELRRVTLAVETIRRRLPQIAVSVDTFRASVMEGVLERFGPCIVNDITAAQADPRIADVAARYDVPFIAMHMRGTPQTMQTMTRYDDLAGDILRYFDERTAFLTKAGVRQIVLDPGFGFSKTADQNFRLLHDLRRLCGTGRPVLAGISRKSMIYKTLGTTPDDALTGTTALHWECLRQGASILRVHDTREAVQVIALYERFRSQNPHTP